MACYVITYTDRQTGKRTALGKVFASKKEAEPHLVYCWQAEWKYKNPRLKKVCWGDKNEYIYHNIY